MLSLSEYATLCEFTHPVNPEAVEVALRDFLTQLNVESVPIKRYDSFAAARAAARDAWDASRDAMAAAWAARAAAWASRDAAWASRDAMAARAAAWAAWDAAWAAWDARAVVWAAWDASYYAVAGIVAGENQHTWEPVTRAFAAGCWQFWFEEHAVGWLPIPQVHANARNQPHCTTGPAIILPKDGLWFLHGVLVSQALAETPADQLDAQLVVQEKNAQVRAEIVKKIGIKRVCRDLKATVMDRAFCANEPTDDPSRKYELLRLDLGDGRQRPYLYMLNPSTGEEHIEGVPAEITTVRAALRWYLPPALANIPVSVNGADWFQQGDVCIWPKGATAVKEFPTILT